MPSGLRKSPHRLPQGEFAFYGDEDFIPTNEYTREQALAALDDARWVVALLDPFPAQVADAKLALVHGTGGMLGQRHSGVTMILGRA